MPSFELHHLSRKTNGRFVLGDINLSVSAGELVAIVAPTGSGKTLLLRMIVGLEPIDSGDVLVDGQSVIGLPPRERGVSLVPSNIVLYPHMTVYANIAFGLKLAKSPRDEMDRRVRDAARALELSALLDRNPHGLTPDKRPLVAIGRAIARKPKVLLLDEPLGSLEGAGRAELFAELPRIHERLGIATVLATRHRDEAEKISSNLMILGNGRIIRAVE